MKYLKAIQKNEDTGLPSGPLIEGKPVDQD